MVAPCRGFGADSDCLWGSVGSTALEVSRGRFKAGSAAVTLCKLLNVSELLREK